MGVIVGHWNADMKEIVEDVHSAWWYGKEKGITFMFVCVCIYYRIFVIKTSSEFV